VSAFGDFMSVSGVRVILENGSSGVIVRRLNAESYEIWLESDEIVILSPKEFKEVEK
jgi:hypothetical protein